MGFQGSANSNFNYNAKFSIYLDPNSTSGRLIFDSDLSYARSTVPQVVLSSDSNWHVSGVTAVYVGSTLISSSLSPSLIFDTNVDAIGFPYSFYNLI